METKNHWDLACRLIEEDWFGAGTLGRLLFKLGSIYPDINIFTYFRGHTYKGAQRSIAKNIKLLQGRQTFHAWDYWRLGVLLHYVADIFTPAHTEGYTGSIWEHRRYERYLRGCFRAHLYTLKPPKPLQYCYKRLRDPLNFLLQKHREYTAQMWHPMRDCAYIAGVCRDLARAIKAHGLPSPFQPQIPQAGD